MPDTPLDPMLEIRNLSHRYGNVVALDAVSLSAAKGEFLTILGESGSGKTTLLRMISGLEQPSAVECLRIGGESVIGEPPARRNCTTVFQNYALFPHMSVAENVAYGLSVRGIPREQARAEALRALEGVRLSGMEDRRISQLSGGQKQRVAIARCVVTRPAIMLLDEPLGALDERLRLDMQNELVDLQRELKMTFIYITHSQEEALAMSDRVVLMRSGRIEQVGAPSELFDKPVSAFAARFMGFENILAGTVSGNENGLVVVETETGAHVRARRGDGPVPPRGAKVQLALRAERVRVLDDAVSSPEINTVPARLIDLRYRGKYSDVSVESEAGPLKLRNWGRAEDDAPVNTVSWRADDCIILDT